MIAYEFQTTVNDGIIHIPDEYRNRIQDKVRIIILSEEIVEKQNYNKNSSFTAMQLDTFEFTFNRDEANDW